MQTVRTFGELTVRLAEFWWRFLPQLVFWCCLGFAAHELAFFGSAALGAPHQTLATVVFILGVVLLVASYVLMIHSTSKGLRLVRPTDTADTGGSGGSMAGSLPAELFDQQRRGRTVARALGPFLAVYALWGLVDDEVRELFAVNILHNGLGGVDQWSINLSRIRFYLVLAVVAWVLRVGLQQLRQRVRWTWLEIPAMAAEGIWVFASFIAALTVLDRIVEWFTTRRVWHWWLDVWDGLLGLLPQLRLPWGVALPEAVDRFVGWVFGELLPGISDHVVLPVMWLALAATVFGWRSFTSGGVLAGTRLEARARALREWTPGSRRTAMLRRTAVWATGDIRQKYLPVLQSLRLLWHGGPRLLGAFVLLATMISVGTQWLTLGIAQLIGPLPYDWALATEPTARLFTTLLEMPLLVALYAATFERAVNSVR